MRNMILGFSLALSAAACMQNGFLANKNDASPSQSLATEPKAQANDRPTETGAGVPGYLVNCSEMTATGELVQVGCNVTAQNGTRVKVSADAWTRFDIKLGSNVSSSIKVSKSVATGSQTWDVAFLFTGGSQADLRAAAKGSTYSYTYVDADGKTVKVESAKPVVTTQTASNQTSTSCSGVVVDGLCVVTVSMSCTDYCGQSAMSVHPLVSQRYGADKQACSDLYAQFPDTNDAIANAGGGGGGAAGGAGGVSIPFVIAEVVTDRGLGCYRLSTGQPLFDTSTFNPAGEPYFGYTRICACTP